MVHFVGAGPGAPDLITRRGAALLQEADCIIYAGSLVNPALLGLAKPECAVYNSAEMTLEQVLDVMRRVEAAGGTTVRLHTGDPCLYGAIREQMDALDADGIPYDDTPGVSSFCGAAAALNAEYTLPTISQTVIITRMEGRTPVPEKEKLASLAAHGATMVIFLSIGLIDKVQQALLAGGAYTPETPAAVIYKASWPEQKVVRCTVGTLAGSTRANGITKTALIVVGEFLGTRYERSKLRPNLYDGVPQGGRPVTRAYLAFTEKGLALAQKLASALPGTVDRCGHGGPGLADWAAEQFAHADALIFVGAVGIAVRAIAPHCRNKAVDPAVVVLDECGHFAVPILSGHLGGANDLARALAAVCGAVPVITTATDANGVFAVDAWARHQNCAVLEPGRIKRVSSRLLAGGPVRYRSEFPIAGQAPAGVVPAGEAERADFALTPFPAGDALHLIPKIGVLGIGCRRGTSAAQLEAAFAQFCAAHGLAAVCITAAASIDLKAHEPGLLEFCRIHGWPVQFYSAAQLQNAPGQFTPSAFVRSVTGVDNVCERAAVQAAGGTIILPKQAGNGVTFALALRPFAPDWRWQDA